MNDRDKFASAALTGLLANGDYSVEAVPLLAYRMADAMIRERGTADRDNCVAANQPEIPCPVTKPMPKRKRADVSAAEPAAWAVVSRIGDEIDPEFIYAGEANAGDVAAGSGGVTVPLYSSPTLTDAEREAIEACVQLIDREKQYDGMPKGAFLRWKDHLDTLNDLLERTK